MLCLCIDAESLVRIKMHLIITKFSHLQCILLFTKLLLPCQVIRKMSQYLKMNLVVPEEYIEGFIKANNTFLYQLVFDPVRRKTVPLNQYPEDIDPASLSYAGLYPPIVNHIWHVNLEIMDNGSAYCYSTLLLWNCMFFSTTCIVFHARFSFSCSNLLFACPFFSAHLF